MITQPTTTQFQTTLRSLVRAIEASMKISKEEKEKLCEQIYTQIRKVTETVLVVNMPNEHLKKLTDQPNSLSLSSYADLISATLRNPKTAPEIEAALTGLVGDITKTIKQKL